MALYECDQGSRVRALTLLVMHGLHQLILFWLLCKSSPFGLLSVCVFEFFFSHIWHLSLLDYWCEISSPWFSLDFGSLCFETTICQFHSKASTQSLTVPSLRQNYVLRSMLVSMVLSHARVASIFWMQIILWVTTLCKKLCSKTQLFA